MGAGPSFWILTALAALGIAQPLLDLLAKNPQFLVVHHLDRWDLVLLTALLSFGPALVFWSMAGLCGLISRPFRLGMLAGSATLLLSALLVPMARAVVTWPGMITIGVCLVVSAIAVVALGMRVTGQPYWNYLGLIPILVAGLFLSQSGPRSIVFPPRLAALDAGHEHSRPDFDIPIVLVVFDAFPSVSLMDEDLGIDTEVCPNLAAFANDAVWYRNALAISDDTLWAVPAVLTGLQPQRGSQPTRTWHPKNLFTWLDPWRPVWAFESHTQLAPTVIRPSFEQRWRLTVSDLSIIYLHTVLPVDLAGGLPPVTHDWLNFAGHEDTGQQRPAFPDRMELLDEYLSAITPVSPAGCYFLHSMFPHTPYQYLPSGRRYTRDGREPSGEGMQWGNWSQDQQAILHSQQRHLLQVGYTDQIVGRILNRLRETDLYEDALVIFTADHGMSFKPEDGRRKLTPTNPGSILPVPLLIKYPGAGGGSVDDRAVQTTDILPTIAAVLGVDLPWPVDGRDLRDPDYRGLTKSRFVGKLETREFDVTEILADRQESLLTKHKNFPVDQGRLTLFAPGRGADLIGSTVSRNLPSLANWSLTTTSDTQPIVPTSATDLIPAEVLGLISGEGPLPVHLDIAIVVDDRIAALTRPYAGAPETMVAKWSTLLPEELLSAGVHEISTILVDWSYDEPRFFDMNRDGFSVLNKNLIVDEIPESRVTGLFDVRTWDGRSTAWSNGAAEFDIPVPGQDNPSAVGLAVKYGPPTGAVFVVTANGNVVGAGTAREYPWLGVLDLTSISMGRHIRLTVYSSTFVPSQVNAASRDTRQLGLALSTVELLSGTEDHTPATLFGKPYHVTLKPDRFERSQSSGFYQAENWRGEPVAWTNGQAKCTVVWGGASPPRSLILELARIGPRGAELTVEINDTQVFREDLKSKSLARLIDVSNLTPADQYEVKINSDTWVPARNNDRSRDHRQLGVAFRLLSLVE